MNHLAKAAGVRKHHYPSVAREKLEPVGGRSSLIQHTGAHKLRSEVRSEVRSATLGSCALVCRLVHAFWKKFPGPRVWYVPYR
jgi:hypothetical protein